MSSTNKDAEALANFALIFNDGDGDQAMAAAMTNPLVDDTCVA
jgi:hypothetical protein